MDRRRFVQLGAAAAAFHGAWSVSTARSGEGYLDLRAGVSHHKLYGDTGPASELWTYNSSNPGPVIRVRQGERVRVRLFNELDEPTSVHWHGIRIDNAMDGVSGLTQDAVAKGDTFDYDFPVPDAGTYWYHAHNRSWNQVARGLYGPLIVEEAAPPFDREHDIVLMLDDWRLDREGRFDAASLGSFMDWTHGGRLGNWLTVNGVSLPSIPLRQNEAYRLRLINACNSRVLELDPDALGARVLAYDGQPLASPWPVGYSPMLLGPAQRVDLLYVPEKAGTVELQEVSGREPFAFARFDVAATRSTATVPAGLPQNNIPEPDLAVATQVRLVMEGGAMSGIDGVIFEGREISGEDFRKTRQVWAFNGVANLAKLPLFQARRGETIVLETVNRTAFPHAIHTHGHHFRILERSNSTVREDRPWRDTFLIGPEQTTKVAFVADNPGKWLLHCHMLEHAAAGMNTWFEVL